MSINESNSWFDQLDLANLRHFFWIVTYGGFSKAARATGTSQPALSLGLQKLERRLGARLVERSARDFELTGAGHRLFAFCQRMEGVWESTVNELNPAIAEPKRRIRLGSAFSIGMQPLIKLCENTSRLGSRIDLEVTSKGSYELVSDLLSGSIDAALLPDDVHDSRFTIRKLRDDELILISSASRNPSGSASLDESVLISYPRETPLRALVDRICTKEGLKFHSMIALDGVEAMKVLVLNGVGVAFVLRSLVSTELAAGTLLELKVPFVLPKRGAVLATRRGETGDELSGLLARLMENQIEVRGVSKSKKRNPTLSS